MWIYLKNNWILFILMTSGSRGSPCISPQDAVPNRAALMDFAVIFPVHLDVTIRPHRVYKGLHTHATCRFNHSRVGEKRNKFRSVSTCHRPADCWVRLTSPVSRIYSNISLSRLLDLTFEILVVSKTLLYLLKDIKPVSHHIETRVCVCVNIHTFYDTTENTRTKPCDLNLLKPSGLFTYH
jgi:hypothetical protein